MTRNKLPALLAYNDIVYRPAGYRVPRPDELYVAGDGHIKKAKDRFAVMDARLIVREHDPDKDFKGEANELS